MALHDSETEKTGKIGLHLLGRQCDLARAISTPQSTATPSLKVTRKALLSVTFVTL